MRYNFWIFSNLIIIKKACPPWMQTASVLYADGACLGGRVRPSWMQTAPLRALLTGVAHVQGAHVQLLTLLSEGLSE